MLGIHNSVASRLLSKHENCFVNGCPCHLAHISASRANEGFSKVIGFDLENLCADLYYWFEKSSKRKGKLLEYFEFVEQDYLQILKHISVRSLSLENASIELFQSMLRCFRIFYLRIGLITNLGGSRDYMRTLY